MFATGAFEDMISAWYFTTPVAQSTINIRSLFAHSPSISSSYPGGILSGNWMGNHRDVSYGIYPFVDGVWELTWDQQVSPRPNLLIETHHNFNSQQGFKANITKANNG